MALKILGRSPRIGKRWPHKALNFLTDQQVRKYLAWKSKGRGVEPPFHIGNAIFQARRVVVLLPDTLVEILVAVPLLQCLAQDLEAMELRLLADHRFTPFLTSLFGPNSVIEQVPEDFYWGETHFKELEKKIVDFQPQMVLNLRVATPILLGHLVQSTQAPLRIEMAGQTESPSANIILKPQTPSNHLRRMILTTTLWRFANTRIACKWTRLKPGKDHLQEASSKLAGLGLRPENTQIFLWPGLASPFQQDVLQKAMEANKATGNVKSLVILWSSSAPFSDPPPPPECTLGLPCLEADSTGLLLGFFDQTPLSIGLQSPLLHLASLADTDVEAHFDPEDAPWDTSFLNQRLRVVYRNPSTENMQP